MMPPRKQLKDDDPNSLRFGVGTVVMANLGEHGFMRGVIAAHRPTQQGPDGQPVVKAYAVALEQMRLGTPGPV